jgi:hypothetical protein
MAKLTEEQARDLVSKVDRARSDGKTVAQACASIQVNPHNYAYWKDRLANGIKKEGATKLVAKPKSLKKALKVTDLPIMPSDQGKTFVVFGSPSALAEFTRSYQ